MSNWEAAYERQRMDTEDVLVTDKDERRAAAMSNDELINLLLNNHAHRLSAADKADYIQAQGRFEQVRTELLRRLNATDAASAAAAEEPCLWCEGTGQEWSSAAKYKRVPCRYCHATGKTTAEVNDGFRGKSTASAAAGSVTISMEDAQFLRTLAAEEEETCETLKLPEDADTVLAVILRLDKAIIAAAESAEKGGEAERT